MSTAQKACQVPGVPTLEKKQKVEGEEGVQKKQQVRSEEVKGGREGGAEVLRVMKDMAEVIWHLSSCLVNIKEELAETWEATVEDSRCLCHLLVNNLRWIDMSLEG